MAHQDSKSLGLYNVSDKQRFRYAKVSFRRYFTVFPNTCLAVVFTGIQWLLVMAEGLPRTLIPRTCFDESTEQFARVCDCCFIPCSSLTRQRAQSFCF
jgi:hypothetical protein